MRTPLKFRYFILSRPFKFNMYFPKLLIVKYSILVFPNIDKLKYDVSI